LADRASPPSKSLEEILAEHAQTEKGTERCEDCGGLVERPTGLPACPETALRTALHQVTFLGEARERGTENLFELFDDLDEELLEHYEKEKFRNERERKRWEERRDELRLFRETCRWLVEQGGRHRQRAVIALGKCGVARRTRRRPRRPSVAHETHRKIGAEGWPERSLPMRVGKKIQTVLPR
jgi:hypothetical protein